MVVGPTALGVRLARSVRFEIEGQLLGIGPFDDVDDHDGDVVAPTVAIGGSHQPIGGLLGVEDVGGEFADDRVEHLVDQTVGTQDEAVAGDDRHRPGVDPHDRLDAEGAGDDVAMGVRPRVRRRDLTRGDQLLHVGVVDAELGQTAPTHGIGPRITHVDQA